MIRSWSHCHSAYPLRYYSSLWKLRMINAYGQGWLIWQRKYGLLDCGDLRSNRGTGIYQTAPKTRSGFWFRSQSIPENLSASRLVLGKGHAYLVRRFCLQFLEDFLWLGFRGRAHVAKETGNHALVPTKRNHLRRSLIISCYRRILRENLSKHLIKSLRSGAELYRPSCISQFASEHKPHK